VLSYVVRVTKSSLKKQPKTLVVVGAYSIGKESVYLAISKALGVCFFLFHQTTFLFSFGRFAFSVSWINQEATCFTKFMAFLVCDYHIH
jgi:DNA cross-link repair 1A protein